MARALLAAAVLALAGCTSEHSSFLDPQGPVAAAQRAHLFEVVGLLMIVVLPVLLLTPVIAWRYRRRNTRARYAPKWDFSWPLEVAIWGVPVCVVAVLGFLLWRSTFALDPYDPVQATAPPLRVQVVGLDWKWLFIYPDERIASVGELAFPADRPLALELTSDTVMQSFFIPALGSQIYAMAGMVTKLHLAAFNPGRFHGENTQFNGKGFPWQKFSAVAMAPDAFAGWVKTVRANGVKLDDATYAKLARRSTTQTAHEALGGDGTPGNVLYFSEVAPDLFATIVNRSRAGQAGQAAGAESHQEHGAASPAAAHSAKALRQEASR